MIRPVLSKRGSYIAEAAVVLPFVILSVITTVLITMYFYESSVSESRMHMALRCEAGLSAETVTRFSEDSSVLSSEALWDGSITSHGVSAAKIFKASREISMISEGLLSHLGQRRLSGELRAADPVLSLRLRQIIQPGKEDG